MAERRRTADPVSGGAEAASGASGGRPAAMAERQRMADPVGGGAGVTSAASGSGPSATAKRRRMADPDRGGAGATLGALGSGPSATTQMRRTAGLSEELRPTLKPSSRAERYDPPPSTGRLQEMGVDSLPSFRFDIVRDEKDPTIFTTVRSTVPAEIVADQKMPESAERYYPFPALEKPHLLQVDLMVVEKGSKECEEMEERSRQMMLEQAERLEKEAEEGPCDTEEHTEADKAEFRAQKLMFAAACRRSATKSEYVFKPPSDTIEEHLTAEEMERQADIFGWPVCSQAQHFATLALEWYNSSKKTHKFEIAKVLLSKCFTDVDYNTYAHVNFTATPTSHSDSTKRLFFAELMLASNLLPRKDIEPMRVLNVFIIDDSCFGGCHEMVRDIKRPVRKDMDYERCHACSERIKHPRGDLFVGGHNRRRMPYVSALPWTYKSQ